MPTTTPKLLIETDIADFIPSQEQIDAFARRLTPEIKKFFADEQVQKEFAEWQEERKTADK
jgi:hypothetical protein